MTRKYQKGDEIVKANPPYVVVERTEEKVTIRQLSKKTRLLRPLKYALIYLNQRMRLEPHYASKAIAKSLSIDPLPSIELDEIKIWTTFLALAFISYLLAF